MAHGLGKPLRIAPWCKVIAQIVLSRVAIAPARNTIGGMAIWQWYGAIMKEAYAGQEFLGVSEYVNLLRWVDHVGARVAVKRGRMVNRTFGRPETQVRERHSARDFEVNREDMVEERGGRV